MGKARRLPVALGGLGAIVLLGLGASFAIGGEQSRTEQVRSALHGGKARNVIFFLGDGMGDQEITAAILGTTDHTDPFDVLQGDDGHGR